ncbi:MAG: YfhO family protein [Flavobacteriaceae bacterium]|nr:YfhO family protein [Flavobacteriaceae bacterium]
MAFHFKRFIPHLVVIILFIVAALAYFSPVLKGKTLFQSDIVQYTGMAKQQHDFRKQTGEETYWTNSAFGGMPTYQLGAQYPHNYIKKVDSVLRFLPRPADYLFLYFIGIYILFMVMKVDYKLAFLGALAFGFSTYLIIIIGVGHNAKAHAIAYMPLVISGIILTFRGKYLYGFLLTTIAMGLELVANHFQMTYYLLLLVVCLGIAYFIDAYKKKVLPHYFKAVGILVFAVVLALGLNATNLLATKEYADLSTRGKSELSITPDGSPKVSKEGLDYEYITEYSYGIAESFNLFIPRFMGGGTSEAFPEDSKTVDELLKMGATREEANQILNQIPMYWGKQPIVAAPAYIGAVVLFLAVLALFLIRGRFKWWAISGIVLSLFLSWGDNFKFLTEFFINYIPLYNKFRAVSSIQVLIELLIPVIAIVGLHQFFKGIHSKEKKKKALLYTTYIVGGLSLLFLIGKSIVLNFSSPYDSYFIDEMGMEFVDAIRADRKALFTVDAIRTFIFVLLTAGVLWLVYSEKLKEKFAIGALALLLVIDLVGVDRRYVNSDDFVSKRVMEQPFQVTEADQQIQKDTDYFRVYDATTNAFSSGRASYFYHALGGYHAAKPRRMNDINDFYLDQGNINILNMMNVKYILVPDKKGGIIAQENPYVNGPAWFVENVLPANNSNEEILHLDSLDTKKTAVIYKDFLAEIPTKNIVRDSTATIDATEHKPNKLVYETATKTDQLAIFSEVYYPKGWNAYIDGKPATYFRANYILRAMVIPAGIHKVEFKFEPEVIATGTTIGLLSFGLFVLIALGGLVQVWRKANTQKSS